MKFVYILLALLPGIAFADFVYEGTLYDQENNTISDTGVIVKVELFDDGVCLLYERQYTLDLSNSDGHFSVDLSTGLAPTGLPHSNNSLLNSISNADGHSMTCANALTRQFNGSYVPRRIRLTILEIAGFDIVDVTLPFQNLTLTPYAHQAQTSNSIQGVLVNSTPPTHGQVLRYDSANLRYQPSDVIATSIDWASIIDRPSVATGTDDGLLSASDKTKLNGIQAGSQVNVKADWNSASGDSQILNKPAIPTAISDLSGNSDNVTQGTTNLFLTTTERSKLSGLQTGSEVNVNADWNSSAGDSQILNKPAIPTAITDLSVAADSISGDAIHGGTISNFSSTGISDASAAVALNIIVSGNIGIGTATPNSALEVASYIQISPNTGEPAATDCDSAAEYGRIKTDTTSGTSALYLCSEDGWYKIDNSGGGGGGGGGCTDVATEIVGGTGRDVQDCLDIGASALNTIEGCICVVSAGSCPSGWASHNNWTTTSAKGCSGTGCAATSCTTGQHGFADLSRESCSHNTGGVNVCGNCSGGGATSCSANITQVGCK